MNKPSVLLAGSTGYLGKFVLQELLKQDYQVTALARNAQRLQEVVKQQQNNSNNQLKIIESEVTKPATLQNCCQNIDIVISCVGITRQKDGLTYQDVDYQANINIMKEAQKSGVKKMMYISAFNAPNFRKLKILDAKERFVDELSQSGLNFTVIRPGGFFSDMGDFLDMAKDGRVYLFDDGSKKLNPIHGEDLAEFVVKQIESQEKYVDVGGPEVYSQKEIGEMALECWGYKKSKITYVWDWVRKFTIGSVRLFTSQKTYGPIEFFLTVSAYDNIAPMYGNRKLIYHFKQQVQMQKEKKK